jgi:replicative DNA helicase
MGTTALAMNIVSRLSVEQGGTILIFSPQMRSDEITIRLLSIAMDLEPENFLNNKVPPATIAAKFLDYYEAKESSIKIDLNSFVSLDDIWEHCCRTSDLRLVIIDPVSAVCTPIDFSAEPAKWGQKEEAAVVFQSLRKLANNLMVPVICLTHLHRSLERRKNKRPHLGDLRKIGIPTEAVDQVIFLYRDRYYDPEGEKGAELIVAKVAQGNVGTVRLDWDDTTRRYTERKKE